MTTIYIATALERADEARQLATLLRAMGHTITYDWTGHGSVQAQGDSAISEVAIREMEGVLAADCFIALLPGGRGTHTELGMALADAQRRWDHALPDKQIHLVGPLTQDNRVCSFYLHPLITAGHPDLASLLRWFGPSPVAKALAASEGL